MDVTGTATFSIALSGMRASSARLNASASNIANVGSTGTLASAGTPYADPAEPRVYTPLRAQSVPLAGGGVASSIQPQVGAYRAVQDPASPYADANGMIAAPDIDLASELVEHLSAALAFKANLSVIRTADRIDDDLRNRLS